MAGTHGLLVSFCPKDPISYISADISRDVIWAHARQLAAGRTIHPESLQPRCKPRRLYARGPTGPNPEHLESAAPAGPARNRA